MKALRRDWRRSSIFRRTRRFARSSNFRSEQVPRDLERLYHQAVAARPELQAQLAAVQRDRRDVELARLAYFPDFAFTVDWMGMATEGALAPSADGVPDVGIGVMVNVPIYRKRLDAGVREAEAKTVASARSTTPSAIKPCRRSKTFSFRRPARRN